MMMDQSLCSSQVSVRGEESVCKQQMVKCFTKPPGVC